MLYFIILFGHRARTSVAGRGRFFCPQCGGEERNYEHKQVRRWFTLFFIPVVPLGLLGQYIECCACGGTFKEQVLAWRPQLPAAVEPASRAASG